MNLKNLHREYFNREFKSSKFSLPVNVKESDVPILPSSKWRVEDSYLVKKFMFMSKEKRNVFISELLEYENQINHHAIVMFDEDFVELKLITKNIKQVTSLDKEYAKYADVLFRDLTYNV
jgi:pterin-4a-carbinolamine dehydratase